MMIIGWLPMLASGGACGWKRGVVVGLLVLHGQTRRNTNSLQTNQAHKQTHTHKTNQGNKQKNEINKTTISSIHFRRWSRIVVSASTMSRTMAEGVVVVNTMIVLAWLVDWTRMGVVAGQPTVEVTATMPIWTIQTNRWPRSCSWSWWWWTCSVDWSWAEPPSLVRMQVSCRVSGGQRRHCYCCCPLQCRSCPVRPCPRPLRPWHNGWNHKIHSTGPHPHRRPHRRNRLHRSWSLHWPNWWPFASSGHPLDSICPFYLHCPTTIHLNCCAWTLDWPCDFASTSSVDSGTIFWPVLSKKSTQKKKKS